MMKNTGIRKIIATLAATALFVLLGRLVLIPSGIINTDIAMQYGVLGFSAAAFGPLSGLLTGLLGHFFVALGTEYDIWWNWIAASGISGLLIGLGCRKLKITEGEFTVKDIIRFNLVQAFSYILAFAFAAPLCDVYIYGEPAVRAFTQGVASALYDIVVTAIVGTLLCFACSDITYSRDFKN